MNLLTEDATESKPTIRVALVESDPLRVVGFRALLESALDVELISASLPEIAVQANIDVVLIGDRRGQNLFDALSNFKVMRPNLPVIVIGPSTDDEIMLNRSEEHTSELQSLRHLVCRLLLEKK